MNGLKVILLNFKQNGNATAYIRLNHKGGYANIKYGEIPAFAIKNRRIVDMHIMAEIYNAVNELEQKIKNIGIGVSFMTAKEIVEAISGSYKKEKEFELDWIEWLNAVVKNMKKRDNGTWLTYNTAKNSFEEFMLYKGIDKLDINDLTKEVVQKYFNWLEDKGIKPITIERYMKNLSAALNMAKDKYNDDDEAKPKVYRNPFKQIDFSVPQGELNTKKQTALSVEQLRLIWNAPEPNDESVTMCRDLFFFSFFMCGMNAIDIFKLEEISEDGYVDYYRTKTFRKSGESAHIRLRIPKCISYFADKYKGNGTAFCFGRDFANITSFNKYIGENIKKWKKYLVEYYMNEWNTNEESALRRLGLEGVTFYTARHTWASIACNDCGIPIQTIDRSLCHSINSVASRSYIKQDYSVIDNANKKVTERILGDGAYI